MKQTKRVELLAPAGNKEAFYGAIHAGADAVYLGGSRFGARAYADNFAEDELVSCIRYAHFFGKRVYLTVNTLVKEVEFAEIYHYLLPFYEAGLDGVIVQDVGVFAFIKENFPDMELHVSTQMTITGQYGASLLKQMGACRVVPARELSLAEIVELKASTGLEIETFIHGAMCYCYSGQCLFSSILGGRSGNRGRCAQPCRLPYRVKGNKGTTEECYPLSLKDMCTIEHIPELIEAGIDSFKIEGRMKKPEYVAGVTAIYRKYIDKYYKSPQKNFKVSEQDLQQLSSLYIRSERQDGYYYKQNGKEMITLTQPSYSGSDEKLLAQLRSTYLEQSPKRNVIIYASFQVGEIASVTMLTEEFSVTVTGDIVQSAQKQPITRENINKQLSKLGDSVFQTEQVEIVLDEQAFYPLKAINELRRKAVTALEDVLIAHYGLPTHRKAEKIQPSKQMICKQNGKGNSSRCNIAIRTVEQLRTIVEHFHRPEIARLYLDGDMFYEQFMTQGHDCWQMLAKLSCEIVIALPYILRSKDETYLHKLLTVAQEHGDIINGFQVRSLEGMGFLKAHGYQGKIFTDAGFYIWNQKTLDEWNQDIAGYCIPYELKGAEQRAVVGGNRSCEKIFYGRIPMMVTANCVARTIDSCLKGTDDRNSLLQLVDRYHKEFPVALNCQHCMNVIYNSVPLSLHKEWAKWQGVVDMRLDFTVEDEKDTNAILTYYLDLFENESGVSKPPFDEYTTGHEKRGVE